MSRLQFSFSVFKAWVACFNNLTVLSTLCLNLRVANCGDNSVKLNRGDDGAAGWESCGLGFLDIFVLVEMGWEVRKGSM